MPVPLPMMHEYFKMDKVSCRIVSDTKLCVCKICIPTISMTCPFRIYAVFGHPNFLFARLISASFRFFFFIIQTVSYSNPMHTNENLLAFMRPTYFKSEPFRINYSILHWIQKHVIKVCWRLIVRLTHVTKCMINLLVF